MTALLAAGLIAALGVIAALIAGSIWLVKKAMSATERRTEEIEKRLNAETELRGFEADLAMVEGALEDQRTENGQLAGTLRLVENQRDAAVRKLADLGDPEGIAASIRADLERMRRAVVPATEAAAGAGGSGEDAAVRPAGSTDPVRP